MTDFLFEVIVKLILCFVVWKILGGFSIDQKTTLITIGMVYMFLDSYRLTKQCI